MSIIDQTHFIFTCPKCGQTEGVLLLDKGSNYSGSCWQFGKECKLFDVEWSGGREKEPEVVKAVCKNCGEIAEVDQRY